MSRPTYLESKQILDAGGIVVRICPATSGLPTRMSEAGWQALCKRTRQREQAAPSAPGAIDNAASVIRRRLNYCAICKGKIRPKGLEIIPAAELAAMKSQHREDASMAKASGKCTACGRGVSALSSCHGEKLCPSCSAVYSAINNRPQVVLDGMRKLKPELLEELAGSPAVQVSVESEALKRIAEAVGYTGKDGEVLVKAVEAMAATMPDCANNGNEAVLSAIAVAVGMDPDRGTLGLVDAVKRLALAENHLEGQLEMVADLQVEVEGLKAKLAEEQARMCTPEPSNMHDLFRALGMSVDLDGEDAVAGAIQTAALLDETERQLDSARMHGLRKNDTMREQCEALAAINQALGLPGHTEAELIISSIGSMMQAVERLRQMAIDADHKADRMQVECNRLENQLANQNEAGAKYIDPAREVLADFAMRVLRGEAALSFGGR